MSVKRQREDAGQDTGRKQFDNVNPANPEAIFETSMGTITCEIFLDKVRERYVPRTAYALYGPSSAQMPITSSNFIDLANSGFYNGLHFHRVIRECVIKVQTT